MKPIADNYRAGFYVPAFPNQSSGHNDYDGWDGTQTIPLDIRTQANYRIRFYTDSTFRMVIDTTYGRVGIGKFFETNPAAYLLDVDSDINVGRTGATDNKGYRIGHNYVLWHNGNPKNIFGGVGAGLSNTTGYANSFYGDSAGYTNTFGFANSFFGKYAGFKNDSGYMNTVL